MVHVVRADGEKPESLTDLLNRGLSLQESSPVEAVEILQEVQRLAQVSLFSSNEDIGDIPTKSLPFLALEHFLAVSYISLPIAPDQISKRYDNLQRACDLWEAFLQRLECLDLLSKEDKKQYEDLTELQSTVLLSEPGMEPPLCPPPDRDMKIARFKAKQYALDEKRRLESLIQRRSRLGVAEHDELDGHDHESLLRELHLKALETCKADALEEWASSLRELPMVIIMSSRQARQPSDSSHGLPTLDRRARPTASDQPLQVTRITQNAMGQLQIRQEEIRSQVFQPHWQQPTMSLEELAEIEVAAALEREQRQHEAEMNSKTEARRFDQLKKDGLEDNADLVDASAELDQRWDDWKDANPRGSGNKRGDVGDRNY